MYSLKWNNYSASVSESFQILRNDYDLVDVTLSCEGKKIPAHKVLLSACSNYFKDVFKVKI
jgi:BTB/POZ domain